METLMLTLTTQQNKTCNSVHYNYNVNTPNRGRLGFDVNIEAKGACRATQYARKIKIVKHNCK